MHRQDFHIPRIKDSVKELAAKTKALKEHKRKLKELRRAGQQRPTIEHRTSENTIVLLDMLSVLEKITIRSSCSRYHQLAYAFARGVPYWKLEQKTRPGNRPAVSVIVDVLKPFIQSDRAALSSVLPRLVQEWLEAQ